ncbi:MAG: class D sortase [Anaerolineaceae bacterium]|nr:class D sortase [Anaerolineaceae bacterium]
MARHRYLEDLSEEELRQLLIEKRRKGRKKRLERYRKTGRLLSVEPEARAIPLGNINSDEISLKEPEILIRDEKPYKKKKWVDRLLVFVELAAVAGLLYVLFNGMSLMRNLNQEVSKALQQPTLTPTPLIMAVVLPSGHTPPDSPGGVKPNEAEIPEHLRPLVQSIADIPIPTPGPEQAVRIQIPSIGVDAPIVQGDGWEQLKKGVGQLINGMHPGDSGNLVMSAHNDVFGEIFRHLDQLAEGDTIILFTSQKTYTYVVQKTQIVEPTFVEVLAPTQEPVITLISCYPYMVDNKRIVVKASLQN